MVVVKCAKYGIFAVCGKTNAFNELELESNDISTLKQLVTEIEKTYNVKGKNEYYRETGLEVVELEFGMFTFRQENNEKIARIAFHSACSYLLSLGWDVYNYSGYSSNNNSYGLFKKCLQYSDE